MANSATAGKPNSGGCVFFADVDADLPVTATEALDTDFEDLGQLSDAGITNSNSISSETVKAWGGSVALVLQTEKEDTFKIAFLSTQKTVVKRAIYGDDNVSGDLTTGITVVASDDELSAKAWVFDIIEEDGILHRIVIPRGKITEIGDIVYVDNAAVVYQVTITAEYISGASHKEYIIAPSESEQEETP